MVPLSQNAQCFFEKMSNKENIQTQEKPYNTGTIDIHKYARRIQYSKKNLLRCRDGDIGIQFLEKLKLFGLSDGRITVYGERTRPLLEIFEKMNVRICNATKKDCETVLSDILSRGYWRREQTGICVDLAETGPLCKKRRDRKQRGWILQGSILDKANQIQQQGRKDKV